MRTKCVTAGFTMVVLIIGLLFMVETAYCKDVIRSKRVSGETKKKEGQEKSFVMTEIELQLQLMSFADRFAAILADAVDDFEALAPSLELRYPVLGDAAYAMAAAFTIAAAPDPDLAVLDMTAMVTLGRIIYDEHYRKKFGKKVEPIFKGYQMAENDIWRIASKVLKPDDQKELRTIIGTFRKKHPDLLSFSHIRFSDFEFETRKTLQAKTKKKSGLFASVEEATRQVEEIRLMTERGMFMASRLPLLAGIFANVWATAIIRNPEVKDIFDDLHRFSEVSDRMTTLVENMPGLLAKERDITIDLVVGEVSRLRQETISQVMNEVSGWSDATLDKAMGKISIEREQAIDQITKTVDTQRQKIFEDLMAQEARLKGLMIELQKTLAAGNNLMGSATALSKRLGFVTAEGDQDSFDIDAYQKTAAEVTASADRLNALVGTVDRLLQSQSLEKILPLLDRSVKSVGKEGEKIIDHTFRQAIMLILIWLVGYVLARFAYQYLSAKYLTRTSRLE